jgi:DNA repair protein RadC
MHSSKIDTGPRERALYHGIESLGDAELIALLLGTGTAQRSVNTVAEALLAASGGLAGLARRSPAVIAEADGIGTAKALRVGAAVELGRRALAERQTARTKLACSREVYEAMVVRMAPLDHEEMFLIALDGQNGARSVRRIAQGGLHGCSVSARDILRVALMEAASAMVLVHNHPSGDPTPSPEDIAMTRTVAEAAHVIGIPLLDHVIVGCSGFASMLDLGVLDA